MSLSCSRKVIFIASDPDDRLFYRMALVRSGASYKPELFSGGQQLLAYLAELKQYTEEQGTRFSCLILLDMHMPEMNGFEILENLQNIFWNEIHVVMVADSASPKDIERGYAMGVARFIKKPSTLQGYIDLLKTFEEDILV